MTGDTRPCYTGPFGTEGVGACEAGVERCIGGQWTGECRLEVLPAAEDICQDDIDNDCDGAVDEECVDEDDAGMDEDPGMNAGEDTAEPPGDEEDPGGCSSIHHVRAPVMPRTGSFLFLLLVGFWSMRRREMKR